MPSLELNILEGFIKTDDQKRALVRRLTDAVLESFDGMKPDQVRIRISVHDRAFEARGGVLRSED